MRNLGILAFLFKFQLDFISQSASKYINGSIKAQNIRNQREQKSTGVMDANFSRKKSHLYRHNKSVICEIKIYANNETTRGSFALGPLEFAIELEGPKLTGLIESNSVD